MVTYSPFVRSRAGPPLDLPFDEGLPVDSDLADAVEGLKTVFQKRKIECVFGKADKTFVEDLRKKLRLPSRHRRAPEARQHRHHGRVTEPDGSEDRK